MALLAHRAHFWLTDSLLGTRILSPFQQSCFPVSPQAVPVFRAVPPQAQDPCLISEDCSVPEGRGSPGHRGHRDPPQVGGGAIRTRPRPFITRPRLFPHSRLRWSRPLWPCLRAGHAGSCSTGGAEAAAAMAPGAAPAAVPVRVLLVLLAAAARPAATWDLWALRCGFSADCECGFAPDLRGQRERPAGKGL